MKITVAGVEYPTKKSLIDAVRTEIGGHPDNIQFESTLLSDLIYEHHYYCSAHDLRPLGFMKMVGSSRFRAYDFMARFPLPTMWKKISWRHCIDGEPSFRDRVDKYYRQAVEPGVKLLRDSRGRCDVCGSTAPLDAHHEGTTFNQIVDAIMPLFTSEEAVHKFGYDWLHHEVMPIPENHPASTAFLEIHRFETMQVLCQACHKQQHKGKTG
jgi:hypothetical protein